MRGRREEEKADATAGVADSSKHHTIRNEIGRRAVRLEYVESAGRYADALTKVVGLELRATRAEGSLAILVNILLVVDCWANGGVKRSHTS